MPDMTWREFKDFVDSKLVEMDLDETIIRVDYIDVSTPNLGHDMNTPNVETDGSDLAVFC